MAFGEELKQARKEKKLTQKQLAIMLEVHEQTIGYWERNVSEPSLHTAIAVANILDISLDKLTGRNCNSYKSGLLPQEAELLNNFRSLDSYGRKIVYLVAETELERLEHLKAKTKKDNSLKDSEVL